VTKHSLKRQAGTLWLRWDMKDKKKKNAYGMDSSAQIYLPMYLKKAKGCRFELIKRRDPFKIKSRLIVAPIISRYPSLTIIGR